jgi:hypothetical protein
VGHHQYDSAEGSQFGSEFRHHQYGQGRQEFMGEFNRHPREFQHLLHQISNDMMAPHRHPLSVEHDRHHNITHINFHHHNIYNGLGQENHESRRHHHHHHGEEATADTSRHHHVHGQHRRAEQAEEQAPSRVTGRDGRPQEEALRPGEIPNPFADMANRVEKGFDKFGKDLDEAGRKIGEGFERFGRALGDDMAKLANSVANHLGTVGDCAHGPRLVFDKLGFHLPPMVATEQGRHVRDSGLFDQVPRSEVRPGDYGVRDWNSAVTRAHGQNKGDSFIVTQLGRHGQLYGANDHHFAVPEDGGRYRNLTFYRPNARFYELMKERGTA